MISLLLVVPTIILESFPISSSGHLALMQQLLHFEPLSQAVDYCLHAPFALMLMLFFYPRWSRRLRILIKKPALMLKLISVGFVTEIMTVAWYAFFSLVHVNPPLWVGFSGTGLLLLSLFLCKPYRADGAWNYQTALLLGCVQGLALIPGISRFGATYVAGRHLGFRARKSFEISFLIEWPLLIAGSAKGGLSLLKSGLLMQLLNPIMLLVMLVAAGGAYGALAGMRYLTSRNQVAYIGFYMLIMACFARFMH